MADGKGDDMVDLPAFFPTELTGVTVSLSYLFFIGCALTIAGMTFTCHGLLSLPQVERNVNRATK